MQTLFLDGWMPVVVPGAGVRQEWVGSGCVQIWTFGWGRGRDGNKEMKNQISHSVSTEKTVKDG